MAIEPVIMVVMTRVGIPVPGRHHRTIRQGIEVKACTGYARRQFRAGAPGSGYNSA
jgi:hypothetical protein